MKKRRWIALGVILLLALGLFATACGEGEETTTTVPAGTETTAPAGTETTAAPESTGTSAASSEPFKISIIISLTGSSSAPAASVLNGAKLEIDAINAAGGINGRPIEYTVDDDKSDTTAGMAAVTKAISSGVHAIVGPFPQFMATPAGQLCDEAGVVNVGFGPATLEELQSEWKYKYYFLTSTGADGISDAWMKMFVQQGVKNIVCIGDQIPVHQESLSLLPDMAEEAGITVTVMSDAWSLDETDVTPIVNKIADKVREVNADAVLAASNPIHAPAIYKGLRGLGIELPIYGGSAGAHPAIFMSGPEVCEGFMPIGPGVVNPAALPDDYPGKAAFTDFAERYQAAYNEAPSMHAGFGYDAIHILAQGLEAGGDDPDAIVAGIESIKDFQGMQGIFNYSATDHVGIHSGFALWKVVNGEFTFVAPLN